MIVTINDIWLYAGIGIIIFQAGTVIALWWLAGGTGRFWIMSNILGRNPIGLIQDVGNKMKFHAIKIEGRAIVRGKRHMPYIDQIHGDQDKLPEDMPDPSRFNEAIQNPVMIDNKIVIMGHEAGGVAFNPNTMKQVSQAYNKEELEEIPNYFVPYSLADIYQLLRIILTPQRAETVFNAGVIKGQNQREFREQAFIAVILILSIAIIVLAYFSARGGG